MHLMKHLANSSIICIEFDTGVTVIGVLDLGKEMEEHELEIMTDEVLPSIIDDVLGGRRIRLQFPPPCTFCRRSVHFNECWKTVLRKIHALLPPPMLSGSEV